MPSDDYSMELSTQFDGLISGKSSIYSERWSMWAGPDDGYEYTQVHFKCKAELYDKMCKCGSYEVHLDGNYLGQYGKLTEKGIEYFGDLVKQGGQF